MYPELLIYSRTGGSLAVTTKSSQDGSLTYSSYQSFWMPVPAITGSILSLAQNDPTSEVKVSPWLVYICSLKAGTRTKRVVPRL